MTNNPQHNTTMNNIRKKTIALILASATTITAMAQESATGYFMENYNMKWLMNPALGNRNGYVGFPGLGNINVSVNGNLSLSDIYYARNGKTLVFTNPEISTSEAMKKFSKVNRIGENLNLSIIQVGFKGLGGYNNIAINVREDLSLDIPKTLFSLAKEGITNKAYSFKDVHAIAKAYAEIALNHSHEIKALGGLRIGASLKLLVPFAFSEANFNDLTLDLGKDTWQARTNAEWKMGLKGFRFKTAVNEHTNHRYVDGGNFDDLKYSPNGFGFGVDLGTTYKYDDLTFSLALTDLGRLNFNSVQLASTGGTKVFDTMQHEITVGDGGDSWNNFVDDLAPLYELENKGDIGSTSVGLEGKFRAGADYQLPSFKKLHIGLLNTTNLSSRFPMTEFRLAANVEPVNGVALGVSAATGTYGTNCGFLLSLGNKGFNFTLGMDYAFFKFDKNYYPLSSNCDVHFGLNFPF